MTAKKKTATSPRKGPKALSRRGPKRSSGPIATVERPKAEFLPGQNYAFGEPKSYQE
jgi:hypothetical protein